MAFPKSNPIFHFQTAIYFSAIFLLHYDIRAYLCIKLSAIHIQLSSGISYIRKTEVTFCS